MPETNLQNLIVINLDGLGARYLGPYGNTWVDTPAINHLAAQSVMFEHAVAERQSAGQALRSLLSGKLALPDNGFTQAADLLKPFEDCWLVSDSESVSHSSLGDYFDNKLHVPTEVLRKAEDPTDTHLFTMFANFCEQVPNLQPPFVAVLNSESLTTLWDAPTSIAREFGDEEDPDPYSDPQAPSLVFESIDEADPDQLLSYSHAYAAQVKIVDLCIQLLIQSLEDRQLLSNSRLIFTSSFGYPMGEHGFVGPNSDCLYGEQTHVPLIVKDLAKSSGQRHQPIFQTYRLGAALGCHQAATTNAAQTPIAFCQGNNSRLVRTPVWSLVQSADKQRLFIQPDDRWETNDAADRCPAVATALADVIENEFDAALDKGSVDFSVPEIALTPVE